MPVAQAMMVISPQMFCFMLFLSERSAFSEMALCQPGSVSLPIPANGDLASSPAARQVICVGQGDCSSPHPLPASERAPRKGPAVVSLSFARFSLLENRELVRFVLGVILLSREDDSRPKIMEA